MTERPRLDITLLRFGQLGLSQENIRNLGKKLKMGMKGSEGWKVVTQTLRRANI